MKWETPDGITRSLAAKKNRTPESKEKSLPLERQFNNAVEQAEWETRNRLSIYPTDNPVSQCAEGLLARLARKDEQFDFKVTVFKGGLDAFVFPNGSVYISDRLLLTADTEEEILFVLQHEKIHANREHSKKMFMEDPEGFMKLLGRLRYSEWEADIRAFDALSELDINPSGGVDFFNKMRSESRDKTGIEHGRDTDRVLNLLSVTYVRDLPSLGSPMREFPKTVQEEIKKERSANRYGLEEPVLLETRDITKQKERLRIAKTGPADQLLIMMPELLNEYKKLKQLSSESAQYAAENQYEIIHTAYERIHQELAKRTQAKNFSQQQRVFLMEAVLQLAVGEESLQEISRYEIKQAGKKDETLKGLEDVILRSKLPKKPILRIDGNQLRFDADNFSFEEQIYGPDDVEELFGVLKPEVFNLTGIKIAQRMDSFVKRVNQIVLERQIYTDDKDKLDVKEYVKFVDTLVEHICELNESAGAQTVDARTLKEILIDGAKDFSASDPVITAELEKFIDARRESESPLGMPLFRLLGQYRAWAKPRQTSQEATFEIFFDRMDAAAKNPAAYPGRQEAMHETLEFEAALEQEFEKWAAAVIAQGVNSAFRAGIQFHKLAQGYGNPDISDIYERICRKAFQALEANKDFSKQFPSESDFIVWQAQYYFSFRQRQEMSEAGTSFTDEPDFNFEHYRKIYQLYAKPEEFAEENGIPRNEARYFGAEELEFSFGNTIERGLYLAFSNYLESKPNKQDLQKTISYVTTEFPYNHHGIDFGSVDPIAENQGYESTLQPWILNDIFKKFKFDLNRPEDLKTLYYLSAHIENTTLAVRLQQIILTELLAKMTFSEAMDFLKEEIYSRRLLSLEAFKDFAENRANAHEEIEEIKNSVLLLLTDSSVESNLGQLVASQELADSYFPARSKFNTLKAFLGNGQNDSMLKNSLYASWRRIHAVNPIMAERLNMNALIERLYSLDLQSKYLLTRELLTGPQGVLTQKNPQERIKLFDYYVDNFVRADTEFEKDMLEVMRAVLEEMAKTTPYHILYFAIAPAIQERLLKRPAQEMSWNDVISSEENQRYLGYIAKRSILKQIQGGAATKAAREDEKQRISYESIVEKIITTKESQKAVEVQSVSTFLLEIAGRLGAPGIRFLQLIGQYVSLSPELANLFRDAYDKVEGQPKFTAHHTILREWPAAKTELPGLGSREGGGSLNSVFRTEKEVEKVLNPNALFHAETSYTLLKEIFTNLSKKYPEFRPALQALEDIRDWIQADVESENFLEDDAAFRAAHDGFTDGGRYQIQIPVSYAPESKYFQREEFIEGKNLTRPEELIAEGHDMKQIVSLVAKDFANQVINGQANSNIHPGNIRVTPDNKVAILDRHFYLKLNMADQMFIFGLTQATENPQAAAESCCNYLAGQGVDITVETRRKILQESSELNNIVDSTQRMLELAIILRKYELRLPLKITLLVQNIFFLDRMAKSAGLANLQEAFES